MARSVHALVLSAALFAAPHVAVAAPSDSRPTEPPSENRRRFGTYEQLVIGLEDVFTVDYIPLRHDATETGVEGETVHLQLQSDRVQTRLNAPTLTFDGFVLPGFSVGLGLTYSGDSTADQSETDIVSDATKSFRDTRQTSEYTLAVSPRVGCALELTRAISVWGRLGLRGSYHRQEQSHTTDGSETEPSTHSFADNAHGLEATASLHLAISPMPYATLLVGPYLEKDIVTRYSSNGFSRTEVNQNPPAVGGAVGIALRL